MGAALPRNLQNMRRGGGFAPPVHEHRIFIKMSFRGAQRRGNPFPRSAEVRREGDYGLPHQCARWFAMTGFLRGCRAYRRGVGDAAPYENIARSAVRYRAARCGHPAPRKHNEVMRREGSADCHVAALLAMTGFLRGCGALSAGRRGRRPLRKHCRECRALSGGGVRAPCPTESMRVQCVVGIISLHIYIRRDRHGSYGL